jgi:hypothetical protein
MNINSGQVRPALLPVGLEAFSFHQTPVLVIENFWSAEERTQFRQAMNRANWNQLARFVVRAAGLPQFRELGEGRDRPTARPTPAEPLGDALHSAVYRVISEHHQAAFGLQLLFLWCR